MGSSAVCISITWSLSNPTVIMTADPAHTLWITTSYFFTSTLLLQLIHKAFSKTKSSSIPSLSSSKFRQSNLRNSLDSIDKHNGYCRYVIHPPFSKHGCDSETPDLIHWCCFVQLMLTSVCAVVAVLRGESKVTGEVQFEQTSEDAPTKITYNLVGLDPSSKRGFHVQYLPSPCLLVAFEDSGADY